MYKNILIAVDGSDVSTRGLDHGLALAKALGAKVAAVTVTEHWSALEMAGEARRLPARENIVEAYDQSMANAAKTILDAATASAARQGVTLDVVHVPGQAAAAGIIETADARGSDLIVMGSHGRRGLGRLILGSQAHEVVTHSTLPVLIVR